jgi:hypothetical protein
MDDEADLRAVVEAARGELTDVTRTSVDEASEYSREGRAFVAVTDRAVEFRLHADVAEAARRTPDAERSDRGDEWVRFAPAEIDQHARDRISAWFLSAWRAAAGKG